MYAAELSTSSSPWLEAHDSHKHAFPREGSGIFFKTSSEILYEKHQQVPFPSSNAQWFKAWHRGHRWGSILLDDVSVENPSPAGAVNLLLGRCVMEASGGLEVLYFYLDSLKIT